ncbi:MAG: GvpL/GvpF family gas vesicle protein [archaeon]|nr:GvpL/GvpF family gas vesicle protein [archaeon]
MMKSLEAPEEEVVGDHRENDKLKEIIVKIVREEIEVMVREAKEEIKEIVRTELFPMLRSAVRESISRELEEVAYQPQRAVAKEEAEESDDEPTITIEAGGDQRLGLYLYGIADAKALTGLAGSWGRAPHAQTELGQIGIEENAVYTIPYKELSAIVHDCPLEPYNSEDEEVVKGWVKTHQHVLDVAEEKFGTVIPFGFDRIIKAEDRASAKEVLNKWMSEEFDNLKKMMEKIRGKKEYGVQIFYIPSVMSEKIAEESEEIMRIKEEIKSKSPGAAYMYKQKLEIAIKKEMESRMVFYFKDFYNRIKRHVEEIKVEKTKKMDEMEKQMIMNLSCLVANDAYKELGAELEEMDKEEGFSVRFTGPWPAYSFVS